MFLLDKDKQNCLLRKLGVEVIDGTSLRLSFYRRDLFVLACSNVRCSAYHSGALINRSNEHFHAKFSSFERFFLGFCLKFENHESERFKNRGL